MGASNARRQARGYDPCPCPAPALPLSSQKFLERLESFEGNEAMFKCSNARYCRCVRPLPRRRVASPALYSRLVGRVVVLQSLHAPRCLREAVALFRLALLPLSTHLPPCPTPTRCPRTYRPPPSQV